MNEPVILVDGGPRYTRVRERHRPRRLHITFGERDSIERLSRTVKEGTKRFYNNVSARVRKIQA